LTSPAGTKKTVAGATTQFLYDGLNPVQELSASGTPTATLLTGLGPDDRYARTESSTTRIFLTDALGSTVALANTAGAVQTSYTYETYGKGWQAIWTFTSTMGLRSLAPPTTPG
jgi:hypothetical protein